VNDLAFEKGPVVGVGLVLAWENLWEKRAWLPIELRKKRSFCRAITVAATIVTLVDLMQHG
jgi:hypothetical protein